MRKWGSAFARLRGSRRMFLAGLLVAVVLLAWVASRFHAQSDAQRVDQRFQEVTAQLVSGLTERLAMYEHGLRGARGAIISAGPQLSRKRFTAYSRSRDYQNEFPGVGGYGYIQRLAEEEVPGFVEQARRDGMPGFEIHELTPHVGEHFVILYLEPAEGNLRALGLDIASETSRRTSAIEAARSGRAVLSRPITLVQREEKIRHGFLLLLPVYAENVDISASDARWRATRGWVFAPLSIETVLGALDGPDQPYALSLTDVGERQENLPFYASPDFQQLIPNSLVRRHQLQVHGRTWLLEVRNRPSVVENLGLTPSWLVGGQILVLGVLGILLWYVWVQSRERKHHADLEQSRLAAMVQGSVDAIIACDNQGKVTHWNPAAERVLGVTASRAVGHDVNELLVDLSGERVLAQDNSEVHTRQLKLQGNEGLDRDFIVIASPFSAADGRIAGTSLLLHDIADQNRAEEHFRLVVEASPNAILMVDKAGTIHLANAKAEELFGYPRDDLLGQSIAKLLPEGARGGHDGLIAHYFASPESRAMGAGRDLYCLRSDGARVPVEIGLNPIVTREGKYALASIIDITERKRQEERIIRLNATLEQQVMERTEQIRTYSSRLSAILQHAGYAVIATDSDGIINLFNPAAERMLGYSADGLIGLKNIECLHDDGDMREKSLILSSDFDRNVEATFTCIAEHMDKHVLETQEWKYRHRDGCAFPVRLSISVLRDERGETSGYLVMAFDLTEQKERDSALRRAISDADQANRYKSDFLANMSHEIRTPMNAILGMLYLMERADLPAASQDMTRKIRLSAQSLLNIINDVLDFSKVEAGRIELEDGPFDLAEVFDSVAALMAASVNASDVEMLVAPVPQGARHLRGDAFRLGQVLVNLVSNAIKFTEHGEVSVWVDQVPGAEEGTVRLRFFVMDTGIGIPEEKRQIIFSPFSQVDSSTTRKYGGTGLGLSICSRLVELMGGALEVDSTPGKGSRFHFELEFAIDSNAEEEHGDGAYRVLVVDDHDIARDHLGLIIRSFGWSAEAVDSGERAVRMLASQEFGRYSIVLMDWQMPGIDGLEAAAAIRSQVPSSRQPIIIMVTGFERKLIEQEPGRGDVDAVLTKPVTASSLYNVIHEVMARRETTGSAQATREPVDRRLAGYKLLVVDDSDINREVAQRILEREGARVTLAGDGRQACDLLQAMPMEFDAVLMDVQMPEMDGYEATARIRSTPSLANTVVIALTAGAFKRQQDAALAAGMNAFVAKPFEVSELVAVIRKFVPRAPDEAVIAESMQVEVDSSPVDIDGIDPQLLDIGKGLVYWREELPYRRYLAQFARRYVAVVETIEGNLRAGDMAAAVSTLHKMRGAAASLALPALVDATSELEELLRHGNVEEDLMPGLRLILRETLADIRQYVSSEPLVEIVPMGSGGDSKTSLADVLIALDSDDPERIDAAVYRLPGGIPADVVQEIRGYVEEFDFRGAEAYIIGLSDNGSPHGGAPCASQE